MALNILSEFAQIGDFFETIALSTKDKGVSK